MKNRFVVLQNKKGTNIGFLKHRDVSESTKKKKEGIINETQKLNLRKDNSVFFDLQIKRQKERTIQFPKTIDLIQINFFKVFDLSLQKKFLILYSLIPLEYTNFNKSVLFEIENPETFKKFSQHINLVVNSKEGTEYQNTEFNLIALIYSFSFFDSKSRIQSEDKNILLTLINTSSSEVYKPQKEILFSILKNNQIDYSYTDKTPDIIVIKNTSSENKKKIAENFDIVKSITSSRTENIRPGIVGPVREYGFEVDVPKNLTSIGIIDTGISKIAPLEKLILEDSFNHTIYPSSWDEIGHGTMVAGLVALGDDFYLNTNKLHTAKAKILNIKALHFGDDDLNIPKLLEDIRIAKRKYGIRLFNMSLVIPESKRYNSSYSQFAYELDRLAFEEDVLLFLSVGNYDAKNLKAAKNLYPHESHNYPAFFYDLKSSSDSHRCEDTNICIPAESLNNISVGALAGNLEFFDNSDITPVSFYPAYYTRKFHFDYTQQVNSTPIKQKNKYLNKPDFVFDGGDLFEFNSGIEVLRSPLSDTNKFYGRTCGTSLATPLITSYASEILNIYPTLKTQTVKALLISASSYEKHFKLEHFKSQPTLLKNLVGFGKPQKDKLCFTENNSIVYVIEDKINIDNVIARPIDLPQYILNNNNKIQCEITLCYSFKPIRDNQLNYLPIYMAFNVVQNTEIKNIAKRQKDYGIKKGFSWSEDHFGVDNKLFSNAQKKTYTLQSDDIINNNGSIAIAVKCLAKNEYSKELSKSEHTFSMVIRITEIVKNTNIPNINLYSEMLKINNYSNLSIIAETHGEQDLELDS